MTEVHSLEDNPSAFAADSREILIRTASPGYTAFLKIDPIQCGEIALPWPPSRRDSSASTLTGSFEPDYFDEGVRLLWLNVRCFVPERLPVLHSMKSQKKFNSFTNGRSLSQPLARRSYRRAQLCVGFEVAVDDCWSLMIASIWINEMITASQLEPVRENFVVMKKLREVLVTNLENHVGTVTLDKMPLVSFVDALRIAVHLTQSPQRQKLTRWFGADPCSILQEPCD